MATIEVRGYVHKPQAKKSQAGKEFSTFGLNVTQKDKAGNKTYAYFNVTDFEHSSPPAEKSYVTVKGYFNVREFEKDGVKRQSLDIKSTSLEVAPPLGGSAPEAAPTTPNAGGKDPWDE